MNKTVKNFLLQNQESFEAESCYIALGTQFLPSLFNDDPRLTFDLFTAMSNLRPYAFIQCMGKILKSQFLKTY